MVDHLYTAGAFSAAFGRCGTAGLKDLTHEACLGPLAAVAIHERVR